MDKNSIQQFQRNFVPLILSWFKNVYLAQLRQRVSMMFVCMFLVSAALREACTKQYYPVSTGRFQHINRQVQA
jgi:hypothetical protein